MGNLALDNGPAARGNWQKVLREVMITFAFSVWARVAAGATGSPQISALLSRRGT